MPVMQEREEARAIHHRWLDILGSEIDFWLEAKRHFKLWSTENNVGVRKGWQLVTFRDPRREMIDALMDVIAGHTGAPERMAN